MNHNNTQSYFKTHKNNSNNSNIKQESQLKKCRSGDNIFTISPSILKARQNIEQNAMKASYIELNVILRTTIRNL
jgi:hypothetical protein